MNVNLPKDLEKSVLIDTCRMEYRRVYRIGYLLVIKDSNDGFFVIDTQDNETMCFSDHGDLDCYLNDNNLGESGELTPYQMTISFK